MTLAAFLPEIAAAAVAFVAARVGDKLRAPFAKRKDCEGAEKKAVVWSYQPTGDGPNGSGQDAWRPVMRHGSC
jgi:hypothetical protein